MTTWLHAVRLPVAGVVLAALVTFGVATVTANAEPTTINGRIAFAGFDPLWRDDQIGQVFTVEMDGTDLKQVSTETGEGVRGVQWTRDGRTLVMPAFYRGVLAMNADGLDRRWLARSATPAYSPDQLALSPDGTKFLTGAGAGFRTYKTDMTGDTWTPLQGVTGDVIRPQWSPDGSRVTFVLHQYPSHAIWVADADGSNAYRLAAGTFYSAPEFSPDGSKIVYVGEAGDDDQVRVVDVAGENDVAVGPVGWSGDPTFSPDGTLIAFRHSTNDVAQVWVMGTDGSDPHPIADNYTLDIDWQPLGQPEEPAPWPATTTTTTSTVVAPTTSTSTTTTTTVDDNLRPTAVIGMTQGANPRTIAVGADKSRDADGSISAHEWRWGDGSAPSLGRFGAHTYAAAGIYTVELVVTDNDGAVSTSRVRVRVR